MNTKNDHSERRKHERYKARDGAFAVLVSDNRKLGQIKDISRGGLIFQYVDNGKPANISSEIELFSTVSGFHLKKLEGKSVEDVKVDRTVPFSSLPMRQLRIKFGEMSLTQLKLLEVFLRQYTHR